MRESVYRRVLPRARLVSADHRLVKVLRTAFSEFPRGVDPIRSVTAMQMRKKGSMEGLVGLTTYCCVEARDSPKKPNNHAVQRITFYSELLDELSDSACVGVIAHELAHAWLNEHGHPEDSPKREQEADGLASRWGYGKYLDALAAETEPV